MNKTIAITTITLVAVIMGMSAIAPAMAFQAEPDQTRPLRAICPPDFEITTVGEAGDPADRNGNGIVCVKELPNRNSITIDDSQQTPRHPTPPRR